MNANLDYDKIYEIRLRVGRPLFYTYDGGEGFLTDHDGKYVVTREDLKETMEYDFDFLSTIKRRAFLWANPLCLFVCGIKCLTICETNDIRKRVIN